MDAAEADADVKLYKASAELLLELRAKIPRLVRNNTKDYRRWVINTKVYEVTSLLDRFQEWPQLLDPYLADLIQDLVDAYLSYCVSHPQEYLRQHNLHGELIPLPRAISQVLYAFCKVRGRKVIVRFFNNEPKYIEPLLLCFRLWTSQKWSESSSVTPPMTWEERYIHLVWLSHLMLAPFELLTISMLSVDPLSEQTTPELYADLPNVAINLAMAGLTDLCVPSKAREAASILLVRLSLRKDMQKLGLPARLVHWAISELKSPSSQTTSTGYRYIGLLALVFGIVNSASIYEVMPFLDSAFQLAHVIASSTEKHFELVRDSAPARKFLVKIMRASVVHAIAIDNLSLESRLTFDLSTMLEDCVQTLLDFLADKDTPVRQAASKALSVVCLKMEEEMSAEIVEAVIDSLDENLLLEDVMTGRLFPITDIPKDASLGYKRNVNAVDPLKWHGCMLTLGHLLFRRALPVSLLSRVIKVLLMGLDFEQRSNVGTSVGVGVRDAACFGIWSLARKYSTSELNASEITWDLYPRGVSYSGTTNSSTLQVIATHLALSACLDPSGNLRRGSSAALQELIGRHPDAIAAGIPVVQAIDYHAVARRSRAVTEVAVEASKLHPYYHSALLYALLAWRGARATDADSRRQAAQAIGLLIRSTPESDVQQFLTELITQIGQLKLSNTGGNAQSRHGLLCCFAATIENLQLDKSSPNLANISEIILPVLEDLDSAAGTISGRITLDIEHVLESISKVILAASTFMRSMSEHGNISSAHQKSLEWAESILPLLEHCTVSSDKAFVTETSALATVEVLKMLAPNSQQKLLSLWLDKDQQIRSTFTCKGRITTLGAICNYIRTSPDLNVFEERIILYMSNLVNSAFPIETKVNVMQSISTILETGSDIKKSLLNALVIPIHTGLMDYTIDQRGDIGSLLRLESVQATKYLLEHVSQEQKQQTLPLLARLAAERLVKVRFQAWNCLAAYVQSEEYSARAFEHQADVSSFNYFRSLLQLLKFPYYREPLLIGLISSTSQGTEDVTRACTEALVAYLNDQNGIDQQMLASSLLGATIRYTAQLDRGDDREIVPALDFFAFMIENVIPSLSNFDLETEFQSVWELCQTLQTASSTHVRLEAMIRIFATMTLYSPTRVRALDRLTRLLLHRWPKIRAAAADAISLYTATDSIEFCDWNAAAAENKPNVLALRQELGVAGANSAPSASQKPIVTV